MTAPKDSIELLPQQDWQKSALGKFLKWALTVGRYIVIVTELVVILAFLSRFKFDRELTDLNETITQQQAVITSYADFEQKFRLTQNQISLIKELQDKRLKTIVVLNELASLTPLDVYLSDLEVNEEQVNLKAAALSEAGLATLIKNLKASSSFKQLTLTEINTDIEKEVGINFTLTSQLAKDHESI